MKLNTNMLMKYKLSARAFLIKAAYKHVDEIDEKYQFHQNDTSSFFSTKVLCAALIVLSVWAYNFFGNRKSV